MITDKYMQAQLAVAVAAAAETVAMVPGHHPNRNQKSHLKEINLMEVPKSQNPREKRLQNPQTRKQNNAKETFSQVQCSQVRKG